MSLLWGRPSGATRPMVPQIYCGYYTGSGTTSIVLGGWYRTLGALQAGGTIICKTCDSFASESNHKGVSYNSSGQLGCEDGVSNTAIVSMTMALGDWMFFCARLPSSSLGRISVLNGTTGQVDQASNSGMAMGNNNSFYVIGNTGGTSDAPQQFAEMWLCRTLPADTLSDLDTTLVRRLAYDGPFSVPGLAIDYYLPLKDNFILYANPSLVSTAGGVANIPSLNYTDGSSSANSSLTDSTNQNMWGPHPPLNPGYMRPDQTMRLVAW